MFQVFWFDVFSCIYYTVYDFENQNEKKGFFCLATQILSVSAGVGLWVCLLRFLVDPHPDPHAEKLCGNSGENRAGNRLYVWWKGPETAGNLPMYALHTVCNQQVRGSSPFTSSSGTGPVPQNRAHRLCKIAYIYGGVPEWPKGADCKSVVDDFSGSNPLSPTILGKPKKYLGKKPRDHAVFCCPEGWISKVRKRGWQNGLLALRQEPNSHTNRIAQDKRASGDNLLAFFVPKRAEKESK